jgi:hypothetical protein
LLQPGQKVFVQHPAKMRWTNTATVVNFGKNNWEYLVRDDKSQQVKAKSEVSEDPNSQTSCTPKATCASASTSLRSWTSANWKWA